MTYFADEDVEEVAEVIYTAEPLAIPAGYGEAWRELSWLEICSTAPSKAKSCRKQAKAALSSPPVQRLREKAEWLDDFFVRVIKSAPYHSKEWNSIMALANQATTGSSSGRTPDFESGNAGSSPAPVTKIAQPLPPKCILCSADAVATIYYPKGCSCLATRYQPRCMQHVMRSDDHNVYPNYVVESFHPEIEVSPLPLAEALRLVVETLGNISRMKTLPDHTSNTFTLMCAHKLADETLDKIKALVGEKGVL